jgi:hypothetical protein
MQHDIYSLGVVLLELGLWHSFINPTSSSSFHSTLPNSHSKDPTMLPFMLPVASEKDTRKRATQVKNSLVTLATEQLPSRMGTKYTEVVLLCLQCMDRAVGFGSEDEGEFYDEDGIVVGVRYIEKILLKMQEISI